MILDNSTVLYIYPKRKFADGHYESYGDTCGCRVVGMTSELKYRIRKCRLDEFVRRCAAHNIIYDDFYIATDFSSLREHVSRIELTHKAVNIFTDKMSTLSEFDLRRVISSLDSGHFNEAILPPVLKITFPQQIPNYPIPQLGNLPIPSSETASASDKLYHDQNPYYKK